MLSLYSLLKKDKFKEDNSDIKIAIENCCQNLTENETTFLSIWTLDTRNDFLTIIVNYLDYSTVSSPDNLLPILRLFTQLITSKLAVIDEFLVESTSLLKILCINCINQSDLIPLSLEVISNLSTVRSTDRILNELGLIKTLSLTIDDLIKSHDKSSILHQLEHIVTTIALLCLRNRHRIAVDQYNVHSKLIDYGSVILLKDEIEFHLKYNFLCSICRFITDYCGSLIGSSKAIKQSIESRQTKLGCQLHALSFCLLLFKKCRQQHCLNQTLSESLRAIWALIINNLKNQSILTNTDDFITECAILCEEIAGDEGTILKSIKEEKSASQLEFILTNCFGILRSLVSEYVKQEKRLFELKNREESGNPNNADSPTVVLNFDIERFIALGFVQICQKVLSNKIFNSNADILKEVVGIIGLLLNLKTRLHSQSTDLSNLLIKECDFVLFVLIVFLKSTSGEDIVANRKVVKLSCQSLVNLIVWPIGLARLEYLVLSQSKEEYPFFKSLSSAISIFRDNCVILEALLYFLYKVLFSSKLSFTLVCDLNLLFPVLYDVMDYYTKSFDFLICDKVLICFKRVILSYQNAIMDNECISMNIQSFNIGIVNGLIYANSHPLHGETITVGLNVFMEFLSLVKTFIVSDSAESLAIVLIYLKENFFSLQEAKALPVEMVNVATFIRDNNVAYDFDNKKLYDSLLNV